MFLKRYFSKTTARLTLHCMFSHLGDFEMSFDSTVVLQYLALSKCKEQYVIYINLVIKHFS